MSLDSYGQSFAELYDLFYSGKPYAHEAAFIDDLVRRRLGAGPLKLLELACGTGNHSFEFERRGYEVTATDLSEEMIRVARHKAATRDSKVSFQSTDMREAGGQDSYYDVVVCLFDSIGYLEENERIAQCLRNIRRRLKPGGLCLIEFWHAAAMLSNRESLRVRKWQVPDAQVTRISQTTCHHDQQCCSVNFEVIVLQADGRWRRFEETHRNRYFLRREMEALLEAARLKPLACYADYEPSGSISEKSWHLISLAEPL